MSTPKAIQRCGYLFFVLWLSACGQDQEAPLSSFGDMPLLEGYTIADCLKELGLPEATDTTASLQIYRTAQEEYLQLSLRKSLQTAHLALREAADTSINANKPVLVAAAQLLCILHYDQGRHVDSILFYEALARNLSLVHTSNYLTARQFLCRSFTELYTYDWGGIGAAANQGIAALDVSSFRHAPYLLGRLHLMQAWSLKKVGDNNKKGKKAKYEHALNCLKTSEGHLRRYNSERWREARRDMVLLHYRLENRDMVAATIASLQPNSPEERIQHYGFTSRLHGYVHLYSDNCSEAEKYYQELLQSPPVFDTWVKDEAYYALVACALEDGDLSAAIAWMVEDYQQRECGTVMFTEEGLLREEVDIPEKVSCVYAFGQLLGLYVRKYTEGNTAAPKKLAVVQRYCQRVLEKWEDSFRRQEGHSMLSQIRENGYQVLEAALASAHASYELDESPANGEILYQTMEKGKSLLLKQQILNFSFLNDTLKADSIRMIQARIHLLRLKKKNASLKSDQSDKELFRLVELLAKLNEEVDPTQQENKAPKTLVDIQARLGPREGVVEYSKTKTDYYGLYFDADTIISFSVPINEEIDAAMVGFIRTIQKEIPKQTDYLQYSESGKVLFEAFLGPFYQSLPDSAALLVIPDGDLRSIPFAAIPTGPMSDDRKKIPFFLFDAETRYASSYFMADLCAERRLAINKATEVAVLTGEDLLAKPIGDSIKQIFPNTRFNTTPIRSIDSFRDAILLPKVLHLFMHARSNSDQVFDNYIQLADNLSITGLEISDLRLKASLVFLAACETSKGAAMVGEGTLSISRNFHQAGAADVIAARWLVPITATNNIAKAFYQKLPQSTHPAKALNLVQRDYAMGEYGDHLIWPQSWAGLVVE